MNICSYLVAFIIFITSFKLSYSSLGDNTIAYQQCISRCYKEFSCPKLENAYKWATKDCFLCRYECIWKVSALFKKEGHNIPQFHGKWPFKAIYFELPILKNFILIQEPASVLFSIFNLISCIYLVKNIKKNIHKNDPLRNIWMLYGVFGIMTWIFSSIFHSFDTWQTELLDYAGAFTMILYQCYGAISFQFSDMIKHNKNINLIWKLLTFLSILFGSNHIYNLVSLRNYGYNMKMCLSISAFTVIFYIYWIYKSFNTKQYTILKARQNLLAILLLTGIGVLFEVFDFPPLYDIFDAHSMFHFFTIPTPILLGNFIIFISKSSNYTLIDSKSL